MDSSHKLILERKLNGVVSESLHAEAAPEDPVSHKVVTEVAAANDASPTDMRPPLYDAIDPGALNALFADRTDASRTGRVSFRYNGCNVTVDSSGQVNVQPADAPSQQTE